MRIRGLRNGSLVAAVVLAVTGGLSGSASGAPRPPDSAGDDAQAVIVVLADQHDEAPATAAGGGRRHALVQADQQPLVAQARQAGAVDIRQFSVLNGFQLGALFVAFVALIATVLLIVVVIRVAAFSRRRETSIMRLVGASNLYIQLPFLLEGAFAGFVGGLLACGALVLGKYLLIDRLFRQSFSFNEASWIEWHHVFISCGLVMAIGLVVSIVVSYLTLLKYLRV